MNQIDGTEQDENSSDLGGFADANGKVICWFGNDEMYYPTMGNNPSTEDARRIIAAVNFCRDFPTEFLELKQLKYVKDIVAVVPNV